MPDLPISASFPQTQFLMNKTYVNWYLGKLSELISCHYREWSPQSRRGNLNCDPNKVHAKVYGTFPLMYPGKILLVKHPVSLFKTVFKYEKRMICILILALMTKKIVYTFHLSRIKATLRLATHVFLDYTPLWAVACIIAYGANDHKVILRNFKTQNEAH